MYEWGWGRTVFWLFMLLVLGRLLFVVWRKRRDYADHAEGQAPPMTQAGHVPQDPSVGPHGGLGPKGYRRSDERIQEDLSDRLLEHAELDAREIEVLVRDGEVTLRGRVGTRADKRLAGSLAHDVAGVIDLHNELSIEREPRPSEASDTVREH